MTRPVRAVHRWAPRMANLARPAPARARVGRSRPAPTTRTDRSLPIGFELVRVAALIGAAILGVLVALPTLLDLAATPFR